MGKPTGGIRVGAAGYLSSGNNRNGLSVRVLGANRSTVTVQFLQSSGRVGRTETYSRRGLRLQRFTEREAARFGI